MKSLEFAAVSGILGAGALIGLMACADSGSSSPLETSDDGGAIIPALDASSDTDVEDILDGAADAAADVDAGSPICSIDGFCHSVVPKGQDLRGVWGDGQGTVWAVSVQGAILRWDGAAWQFHEQGVGDCIGIWGSGPRDVWVVTTTAVLRGQGPSSEELVFSPVSDLPGDSSIPIMSIWGTGPSDIWAVGGREIFDRFPPTQAGRVLHFGGDAAAGGTGWAVDEELSSQAVSYRAVWGSAVSGTWVDGRETRRPGGYFARVLRRAPGATGWTSIELPDDPSGGSLPFARPMTAANVSPDLGVVLRASNSDAQLIWRGRSSDSGASFSWTVDRRPGPGAHLRATHAFWGSAANDMWAVGAWGNVSHWDGTQWQQANIRVTSAPVGKTFWAIWGNSSDDFWIVGDEIALHKTTAGRP